MRHWRRWLACGVLALSAAGCIEEPCRPGSVYITIDFVDSREQVDGVALKYQLDSGPVVELKPAVPRPLGTDRGSLELRIKDYAKYTQLTLQFAPTKNGVMVGEWQSKIGKLAGYDCALAEVKVQIVRRDAGSNPAPDAAPDVRADATADRVADAREAPTGPDLEPDGEPDTEPDAEPDVEPDAEPDGAEDDAPPDAQPDQAPDMPLRPDMPFRPPIDTMPFDLLTREARPRIDLAQPDLAEAFVSASASSLAFGSIAVGTASAERTVSLTNPGQQPTGRLSVTSSSTDFQVLTGGGSDCGYDIFTLGPGGSCLVRVAFRPSAAGIRSGSLQYSASSPATTGTVSLSGSGFLSATLSFSPATCSFPDTPVGDAGATRELKVLSSSSSETETGAMTFSIGGVNAPDFSITSYCTMSLPPGGSCLVRVRFSPSAIGPRSAQLNVVSEGKGTASAALDGKGVPQIEIVPNPTPVPPDTGFDFGQTTLGTAGLTKTYDIWVRSGGQTTLSVTFADPSTPPNFRKIVDTCGGGVLPSLSAPVCQISVQFFPQLVRGAMSATLSVSGSAGGSDWKTFTGTSICTPACSGKCGGPDGCLGTCPDNCLAPQVCGGAGTAYVCGQPPACTTASGAATWGQITKTSPWPEIIYLSPLVHDVARDRFVVLTSSGKTWEWDPSTPAWVDRTPATSPSARQGHSMGYDASRKKVLLFGGAGNESLRDTWEWDGGGGTWSQLNPSVVPPATFASGMAYDPVRARIVMAPSLNGSLWEWDGSNWTERAAATGTAWPPGPNDLMWDSTRQRILLMQQGDPAVWEWRPADASWARLSFGCAPTQREYAAAAYVPEQDRLVLFGGGHNSGTMTFYQDLWSWAPDGSGWQSHPVSGSWPSKRYLSKLVYDALRKRLLLFGGASDAGAFDDLWELRL